MKLIKGLLLGSRLLIAVGGLAWVAGCGGPSADNSAGPSDAAVKANTQNSDAWMKTKQETKK